MAPKPTLDHIVLLVPPSVLASVPAWLADSLTVLPGGRHADGLTENKLVVFRDGTYLELIAFVPGADEARRAAHKWGRLAEGQIIDWALGLADPDTDASFAAVQARVRASGAGVRYEDLIPGGRTRPDGVQLRWAVSAAEADGNGEASLARGELPFWCLDRTPRELRVPHQQPGNAEHSCDATGLASVTVFVRGAERVQRLRKVYEAFVGSEARMVALEPSQAGVGFSWGVQAPVHGGSPLSPKVVLRELSEEYLSARELVQLRDTPLEVLVEIALFTKDKAGQISGKADAGHVVRIDLIPTG